MTPPKGLDAPPQAVAAAKTAPATRINPGRVHQMLQVVDFNDLVQNVVKAHRGNVDVVKADNQELVRPRGGPWGIDAGIDLVAKAVSAIGFPPRIFLNSRGY
jgi:hypothetical protein